MGIKQYCVPGIAGILLGIVLVSWIQPTTYGGVGLILLISILLCVLVASAIGLWHKK